jgi:hypothetical protein
MEKMASIIRRIPVNPVTKFRASSVTRRPAFIQHTSSRDHKTVLADNATRDETPTSMRTVLSTLYLFREGSLHKRQRHPVVAVAVSPAMKTARGRLKVVVHVTVIPLTPGSTKCIWSSPTSLAVIAMQKISMTTTKTLGQLRLAELNITE